MKAEYDLSKLKSRKNPYASKLKKLGTMRLSEDVVQYFKGMPDEAGVSWQACHIRALLICSCATVLPAIARCKSNA